MRWRRSISAVLLAVLAGALVLRRGEIAAAVREIGSLSPAWVVALLVCAAAATTASGWLACAVSPTLGLGRGVMVQQATLGTTNTGVGSGPIALGVRVSMLRSWGLDEVGIGIAVLGVNVAAALKLWAAALIAAIAGLAGVADGVIDRRWFWLVAGAAVLVLGTTSVLTWLVLCHPAPLRWVAGRLDTVLARAARRRAGLARWRERLDLEHLVERFRTDAGALARTRGWQVVAAAGAEQLVLVLLPLVIVRAFGIGDVVITSAEVVVAFVLVRLAASLTAIPGGIGVTELGLTAALTRFGVPQHSALAVVLTFRAVTYLLPIALGAGCLALWRRGVTRTPVVEPAPA